MTPGRPGSLARWETAENEAQVVIRSRKRRFLDLLCHGDSGRQMHVFWGPLCRCKVVAVLLGRPASSWKRPASGGSIDYNAAPKPIAKIRGNAGKFFPAPGIYKSPTQVRPQAPSEPTYQIANGKATREPPPRAGTRYREAPWTMKAHP